MLRCGGGRLRRGDARVAREFRRAELGLEPRNFARPLHVAQPKLRSLLLARLHLGAQVGDGATLCFVLRAQRVALAFNRLDPQRRARENGRYKLLQRVWMGLPQRRGDLHLVRCHRQRTRYALLALRHDAQALLHLRHLQHLASGVPLQAVNFVLEHRHRRCDGVAVAIHVPRMQRRSAHRRNDDRLAREASLKITRARGKIFN